MTEEGESLNWSYTGIATQPVGVPATMGFSVVLPTFTWVRGLLVRHAPKSYGAGRQLKSEIHNVASVRVGQLSGASADNQQFFGGLGMGRYESTVTASTINAMGMPPDARWMSPDTLEIFGASLANTEQLSVIVQGQLFGLSCFELPVITPVGSGVVLSSEANKYV